MCDPVRERCPGLFLLLWCAAAGLAHKDKVVAHVDAMRKSENARSGLAQLGVHSLRGCRCLVPERHCEKYARSILEKLAAPDVEDDVRHLAVFALIDWCAKHRHLIRF